MDLKISISKCNKEVEIELPASKSISNRLLIIKALADSEQDLVNVSDSDDTSVLIKAINDKGPIVDIGKAGTAMRFLTAYYAVKGIKKTITGDKRMQKRPIGELVEALNTLGADIQYYNQNGFPPISTSGKTLQGGKVQIQANISSQYISALLLIAPYLKQGLELEIKGTMVSEPYIKMTLNAMLQCGVKAKIEPNKIIVTPQKYDIKNIYIENDWSSASYWYETVSLLQGSTVLLKGLTKSEMQGDAVVADYFDLLGVKTEYLNNSVKLTNKPTTLNFFQSNMIDCPDLIPTLVVTLCAKEIPFVITGTDTLKVKETDRVQALITELSKFGYHIEEPNDGTLRWDGKKHEAMDNTSVETYSDHRMAMSFAPLATIVPITIKGAETVSKSYPKYWKDLRRFGFEILS